MSLTYVTATIDRTTGGMSTRYAVQGRGSDHVRLVNQAALV